MVLVYPASSMTMPSPAINLTDPRENRSAVPKGNSALKKQRKMLDNLRAPGQRTMAVSIHFSKQPLLCLPDNDVVPIRALIKAIELLSAGTKRTALV